MTWAILIAAIVCNAFGRRFAGGLLGQWLGPIGGTQVGRLAQAGIAGATILVVGAWLLQRGLPSVPWWWGPAIMAGAFAGATVGFPRNGMLPRNLRDVLSLSVVHGLLAVTPIAAVVVVADMLSPGAVLVGNKVLWLGAAGLARGPFYWLATLWQPQIPALGLNPDGLPDPPPFAEFLSGGALGAALVLMLLPGA
jgi:hypothetical protein